LHFLSKKDNLSKLQGRKTTFKKSMSKAIHKIIIRTPNWLGDLMMSTAFIYCVLKEYPDSQVDLIVKKGFEVIPLPHRGEIIAFDKSKEKAAVFGKKLRKNNYDLFYVLPPSFSAALMAYQSRAIDRIGYQSSFRGWLFTHAKYYQKKHRNQHLIQEYLQLVNRSYVKNDFHPKLDISEEWVQNQLKDVSFDLPEKFIAFAPSAIYGPAKKWPAQHFHDLAKILIEKEDLEVIVLGAKDDIQLGEDVKQGNSKIHNLCGKTSLPQLFAILTNATSLVSNDSGVMHVGTALQIPQVAIFGSSEITWTGPENPKAQTISMGLRCAPCFQRKCKYGHYDCLVKITPEMVFQKIKNK
jgi:heptosyltransferase-2